MESYFNKKHNEYHETVGLYFSNGVHTVAIVTIEINAVTCL